MTEEQQRKLSQLKKSNKDRLYEEKVHKIKNEIYCEIPDFDNYFRFANTEEIAALHAFVNKIPALTPLRPDFNLLPYSKDLNAETLKFDNTSVWLDFLCGSEGIFDVCVLGKISDFMKYYYEWEYIAPYIMFVYEDMNRFIFVDDECEAVESCLEIIEGVQ